MGCTRTRPQNSVVVAQLVFALGPRPVGSLSLVARLGSLHGQASGAARLDGGQRKNAIQIPTRALGTRHRFLAAHEGLEAVATALAGVFEDRYDGTRISRVRVAPIDTTPNHERHAMHILR